MRTVRILERRILLRARKGGRSVEVKGGCSVAAQME